MTGFKLAVQESRPKKQASPGKSVTRKNYPSFAASQELPEAKTVRMSQQQFLGSPWKVPGALANPVDMHILDIQTTNQDKGHLLFPEIPQIAFKLRCDTHISVFHPDEW